ncbi:MAG: hypothetical protein JJLCMIEE_00839 [Acidimicrobiales bacterium]|nr:hypothetical protein [Acidimicrobiales bacterium]
MAVVTGHGRIFPPFARSRTTLGGRSFGTRAARLAAVQLLVVPELGHRAAAWDELAAAGHLPSPFLRSWWLERMPAGDPVFVLLVERSRLVGGAAFQRRRRLGLELIEMLGQGPLAPDHLDLVCEPDRETSVFYAVRRWLDRPGGRLIDLQGLAEGARLVPAVPGRGAVTQMEVAPYAELSPSFPEYLSARPGRLRNTVARGRRRLEREGVHHRRVGGQTGGAETSATQIDRALSALRRLHEARWKEHSSFLSCWEPFAAAVRLGARDGEVVFHELVHDDTVIATEVEFDVAGRVSFYQAGRSDDRRWRGAGTALKSHVVEWACKTGRREFDLLRGDEPYKGDWATGRRRLWRVRRARGAARPALAAITAREQLCSPGELKAGSVGAAGS